MKEKEVIFEKKIKFKVMIRVGAYAQCIDMTGVNFVKIFKVLGASYKNNITLGDVVYVVIRGVDTSSHYLKDERMKFKFRVGSIHRAIVVHMRQKYIRKNKSFLWFPWNAVILVSKQRMPFSKKIKAGIPREVADKYPIIGSISPRIL